MCVCMHLSVACEFLCTKRRDNDRRLAHLFLHDHKPGCCSGKPILVQLTVVHNYALAVVHGTYNYRNVIDIKYLN